MRRILAYSIVNQVGFMVCGIGIGTAMALNGAAAHAFAHIIYKALLLMSAGSVLYMTGKRKCTDLGGLYHSMPITMVCGIVGALAISSFPLTSGFVTKSMINSAAADQHHALAWFVLTAASAGVFLHAGIKFPWFVFFQKDSGLRPPDPPWNMRAAMIFFAVLCVGLGVPGVYQPLYAILPFPAAAGETLYVPYTGSHVISQLQLLLFSGLAFFVLLPVLKRTLTITLDADWFYRRLFPGLWKHLLRPRLRRPRRDPRRHHRRHPRRREARRLLRAPRGLDLPRVGPRRRDADDHRHPVRVPGARLHLDRGGASRPAARPEARGGGSRHRPPPTCRRPSSWPRRGLPSRPCPWA
jgi:NADH:ubiquinone oxidoreductase subunit 5 (subunit L)/multisubunit Na+/H+ antiporter MnhA subunit